MQKKANRQFSFAEFNNQQQVPSNENSGKKEKRKKKSQKSQNISDGRGEKKNLLVAVRVRPLLQKEAKKNKREIVEIQDSKIVCLTDP